MARPSAAPPASAGVSTIPVITSSSPASGDPRAPATLPTTAKAAMTPAMMRLRPSRVSATSKRPTSEIAMTPTPMMRRTMLKVSRTLNRLKGRSVLPLARTSSACATLSLPSPVSQSRRSDGTARTRASGPASAALRRSSIWAAVNAPRSASSSRSPTSTSMVASLPLLSVMPPAPFDLSRRSCAPQVRRRARR